MLYDHGFETEKTTIKSEVKHNPGNKKYLKARILSLDKVGVLRFRNVLRLY